MTVGEFWAEFCAAAEVTSDVPYQVWYFGNSREMAAELAELVVAGKKTATASLAEANDLRPDDAPVLGGYSVVTDFDGEPRCVIRTTEMRRLPFAKVDEQFAADEGEGDLSYEYWRRVHLDYFRREAAELGITFGEGSIICCERFELLYPR